MTRAIVPSNRLLSQALLRTALRSPKLQAAYKGYLLARKYGPAIYRGAKYARRTYRKARNRAKQRRKVGAAPGTSSALRAESNGAPPTQISSRTLYQAEVTLFPAQGATTLDSRQRNRLYWSGFRIYFEARNTTVDPIRLNIAFVHPKNDAVVTTTDFFRGFNLERSFDFTTSLSSLEFDYLPINSDKFDVFWRKRFLLHGARSGTQGNSYQGQSFVKFKRWTPMKRKLNFDDTGDTAPQQGRCFLVWWCDKILNAAGTGITGGQADVHYHFLNYYRDEYKKMN